MAILVVVVVVRFASAVEPVWQVAGVWRQPQGLPQQTVNRLLQTRDGYIWVATKSGLARFDGARFTIFDTHTSDQILGNEITALAEAANGDLWIGAADGGVSIWHDGRFTAYTKAQGLVDDYVTSLAAGPDGSVWIGTDHGISRYRDGRFANYPAPAEAGSLDGIQSLSVATDGTVWAGTAAGEILRLGDNRFVKVPQPAASPSGPIYALLVDHTGAVWFGDGNGLFRLHGGQFDRFTPRDGLGSASIRSLHEDHTGNLWIGTSVGLNRFKDGRFETIDVSDQTYPRNLIAAICSDHEGSLWIGANGIKRLHPGAFTAYGTKDGLSYDFITAVLPAGGDALWVGTGLGLNLYRDGKFSPLATDRGLPADFMTALAFDRQGRLWAGSTGGVYRSLGPIDPATATESPRFERLAAMNVRGFAPDRTDAMWISTRSDGVWRFDATGATHYTTANGLTSDSTVNICADREGAIWVATRDGLARFRDGGWHVFHVGDGLVCNMVHSLYVGHDGALWIGTRQGVSRFADGKFSNYTVADGLFDDFIYSFIEDGQGGLYMTSPRGVFRVALSQLEEFTAHRRGPVESYVYGPEHGLVSAVASGGYQPVANRSPDGRLWFATASRLAALDLSRLATNPTPPLVHLEAVSIDGRDYDVRAAAVAPPGRGDLTFRFTALSFLAPEKVHFKYKLEGYDRSWIDVGNRRDAFYNNLPPGPYRFQVVAANNDGVWNTTGASFAVQLRPHFYQTPLFSGVCVGAVLAAGFGMHLMRLRRLRHRSAELSHLVAERTEANRLLQIEIADRQAAEQALRVSEERYRRFFEEDLSGAFIASPGGLILACNPAFARILGYGSPAAIIGRASPTFYRDLEERAALMTRLQRDVSVRDHFLHLRRCDGAPVDVIANVSVTLDERGQITETKGYIIDITERNRLEAQLRQAQKMEAVGRLAGGIAHDFNNLLTAIIGYSQMLAEEPGLSPNLSSGLAEIRNAGNLAAALTRQLLAFSRRQILQPCVLDLNVRLGEVQHLLRRLIGEDIAVAILPAPQPAWIEADPGQIEQVVLNLVINARDAMPKGGRLTIAISFVADGDLPRPAPDLAPGPCVKLSVADTGIGMAPDVQAHLFEPFFTTKPVGHGTGLGLSTVYGIVRQSRGHISVQSAPGAGSTFDIFLPTVPAPPQTGIAAESPPRPIQPATILLVEDSEPVRRAAAQILRRHGYTVVAVPSATAALQHCETTADPVDLVLTDVVMPELSGLDLAKKLAELRPALRVLFMSGYTEDAIARYGMESSQRFVQKPFTTDSLLRKVRSVLSE